MDASTSTKKIKHRQPSWQEVASLLHYATMQTKLDVFLL
jgi:hypothetical protein